MFRKTIRSYVMDDNSSTILPGGEPPLLNRTFNLEALRSFVAICETGTFRRAAARVNRSPSALSLQIGKLEELTGGRLMTRDARHVELTEHGEVLLCHARKLLGLNDETMALLRGSHIAGRLRLAAPHDLGVSLVPGLLRKLAELHPGIVVDVRLGTSETVQELFLSGEVNVALFNEVKAPALQVHKLTSEPLAWIMSARGRAIEQRPVPLAIADIGCAWRTAALRALEKQGLAHRIAYSSDTSMGQIAALQSDLAVAVLPKSLAAGYLIEVPTEHGLPPLPLTHIYLAEDGSDQAKALTTVAELSVMPGRKAGA